MSTTLDPKAARRSAYRTLNGDGLLDISLGCIFLLVAAQVYLLRFTEFAGAQFGAIAWMPFLLIRSARNRWTYPRIGYVNLDTHRKRTMLLIGLAVLALLGVAVLLLTMQTGFRIPPWVIRHSPAFITLVFAGKFAYMGYQYGIRRFLFYATLALAVTLITYLLGVRTAVKLIAVLGIPGVLMVPIGIALLVRFIRTHPKLPQEEGTNVSG
jgi:hypothetical protein